MRSLIKKIIKENIDDILDKISAGENLTPSDKRKLDSYTKHLQSGGSERNFTYSDEPDYHDYRGKTFKYEIGGKPLTFKFDEKSASDEGFDYFGQITYDGDEYIGGIFTDENGFLIDFDFYNSSDEDSTRLQDLLKDFKYELQHFFQEEVVPEINL